MPEKEIKKHDDSKCFRCGEYVFMFQKLASLAGGFHAVLCVDCLNDWHLFIKDEPTWLAWIEWRDHLYAIAAQTQHDGDPRLGELEQLRRTERELDDKLFLIAETWSDDRIERPKPEPLPPLSEEEIEQRKQQQIQRLETRLQSLKSENAGQ